MCALYVEVRRELTVQNCKAIPRRASEMSSSDTMSEASSPQSYLGSPNRSPCQQVPQLANCFTELSCAEPNGFNIQTLPFLRIVEQPQDHFRFRYKSEMVGTHGCLLGKSSVNNKTKTHPMVELVNYKGHAVIRCRLAQHLKPDEHPHQLLEDEQEDRDVSAEVPERGSYRVGFAGMGIIHTAKKDVPGLLYKKYKERSNKQRIDDRELMSYCEAEAKGINLNIVRLRFSAHDYETGREICEPVFSEPIHNMKSAATNDLKICRISKCSGRPKGNEDVYILVEKVNRKNIKVRFVERNEADEEVWSAEGHFLQTDVHHQYAIVFRTPAYKDQYITQNVKVWVELLRPSDGRCSEPKEFTYIADQLTKHQAKKRKTTDSPYSSFNSLESLGSSKSFCLPATVQELNQQVNPKMSPESEFMVDLMMPNAIPVMMDTQTNADLGDALLGMACDQEHSHGPIQLHGNYTISPMMPQADPPAISLNSTEFANLLKADLPPEDRDNFTGGEMGVQNSQGTMHGNTISPVMPQADPPAISLNSTEFANLLKADLPPEDRDNFTELCRQYIPYNDFLHDQLEADSGRGKTTSAQSKIDKPSTSNPPARRTQIDAVDKTNTEYTAVYTPEHGTEVKKLVKEICDLIRNKTSFKKQVAKEKLERLFAMRLSNGDTFLHMSLYNNRLSFEYIVKLINAMKMHHLLNLTNNLEQTILHSAIINDVPQLVKVLVANGCDPMIGDRDGNNAVHYAVQYGVCLEALLEAVKAHRVSCDLNAVNKEKQTALHLAMLPGPSPCDVAAAAHSARQLLARGASHNTRDVEGRTPLHLAAYDDCLPCARVLLEFIPESDIEAEDGRGLTALQIVCGGAIRPNTLEFVNLLILKKADPNTHSAHTQSAWSLSRDKPQLRAALQALAPRDPDIKSEPEDEYESADEGDDTCLSDLGAYASELAAVLDASGAWRQLAERLRHDALANWYENTPSPTRTLLNQLKECGDNITTKSLLLILEDIGQAEAARVIRNRVGID